jgi:hypothetical protein
MIPSTFGGLVLLLVFLMPGLAYVLMNERHRPVRTRSAFRETAVVLLISGLAYVALSVIVFAVTEAILPLRSSVQLAFTNPVKEYGQHPEVTAVCVLLAVLVATAGAGWSGSAAARRVVQKVLRRGPWVDPTSSSWWVMFDQSPDAAKIVSVTLTDDTWLGGELYSWSRTAEETADRELVLRGPIHFRAAGAEEPVEIEEDLLTVSARQIRFITVKYSTASTDGDAGDVNALAP